MGRTDIFTMLSLPIHEHGLSFHLFKSAYKSRTCFIKFIPKSFSLGEAIINGIVFNILDHITMPKVRNSGVHRWFRVAAWDPPLCNLPRVSSVLGLPFLVLWQESWGFYCPMLWLTSRECSHGGWTEKKKNEWKLPSLVEPQDLQLETDPVSLGPEGIPPLLLLLVLLLVPN